MNRFSLTLLFLCGFFAGFSQTPPYLDPKQPVEIRVQDLLGRMTLDEKIGQMMQVDHTGITGAKQDITKLSIGSILSGGDNKTGSNTVQDWADLVDTLQGRALKSRLKIPLLYGIDAVHGFSGVTGTTLFPHNIGLGATRDSALVAQVARITAIEVASTGINWTFAPCNAVVRDERWGRTYEGFGETPELAVMFTAASVLGYQGDSLSGETSIIASAKHFLGDGGTFGGDDQGNTIADEVTMRKLFLPGYISAVKSGSGTIMASYNSINGLKMHANKYWMTDVLKTELGFDGFIISDWAAVDQLPGSYSEQVKQSINAGVDMVMLPFRYNDFLVAMKSLVTSGEIPQSRVDDAVTRILRIKFRKGVFEKPFANRTLLASVGSAEHRAVARKAVSESLVLLKRKDGVLPISKSAKRVLVAGSHANDIGLQSGGWSITWQGKPGATTTGTTILNGFKKVAPAVQFDYSAAGEFTNPADADYSVVVIGETPYAEGQGDRATLELPKTDVELLRKMKNLGHPVVLILISGRPMILTNALHFTDAIIAAWLPGTEGDGIADVLFGDKQPHGLLPHTWPKSMSQIPINFGDENYHPLFPYGYGIQSFSDSDVGSVPVLQSTIVAPDGSHIELTFNKEMKDPAGSESSFRLAADLDLFEEPFAVSLKPGDSTTLVVNLGRTLDRKNVVTISYLSGSLQSKDGGMVSPFSNEEAVNWIVPAAIEVPARIGAEKFSDMSGVEIEPSDEPDGGFNLTSIDDGDWMEYRISSPVTAQKFIYLRISSASIAGSVTFSIGTKNLGTRSLPVTGSWTTWTTVKQLIGVYAGEQTFKIAAGKGGFKLHWLSIENTGVGVEDNPEQPNQTRLEQNYPNPFNPTTDITFTTATSGQVTLKVFNLLGQEVKTLVDEIKPAGTQTVRLDGSDLKSGVYFCRMTAGNFSQTRKIVLLK
ncbi:MAG: glycoside hydrolase family 3 C-terminal domain-containing protein [Bacteroidetes bacterium]|nr:glycoside hydrolase family 3 C-terminal domain-containing protein [Bacteroidota bacterium]